MTVQVLFTGHAPVHYSCFRPLAHQLRAVPGVRVFVGGGLKTVTEDKVSYDAAGLYGPFGLRKDEILQPEEIAERDFDVVFAANTKFLKPRSYETSVQIFHGISFRNKAVREANMGCDYYFLVGPYMKRRFAETELLGEDDPRGLPIGFMKTDRLIDGSLDKEALMALHGLDPSKPVLLYAPTGQRHNSLETMGESVLRNLSAAGAFQVLVKPHDHAKDVSVDWPTQIAQWDLPGVQVAVENDVTPLLYLADLLITDASSVSSEYSLLDRPMVFLDVPKLLKKAQKSGSMDLDTWGRRGGMVVTDPGDIVSTIDRSLEDPARHRDVRVAMSKDLFFNPGRATVTALDWFRTRFSVGRTPEQANSSTGAE